MARGYLPWPRGTYLGWRYLPWLGRVPTFSWEYLPWLGNTYLGWVTPPWLGVLTLAGVPTLAGGTYLGQGYLSLPEFTYLVWGVPTLAWGYPPWPDGYLPWPEVYPPWPGWGTFPQCELTNKLKLPSLSFGCNKCHNALALFKLTTVIAILVQEVQSCYLCRERRGLMCC